MMKKPDLSAIKKKRSVDRVFIDLSDESARLMLTKELDGVVSIVDLQAKSFPANFEPEAAKFINHWYKTWKVREREAWLVLPSKFVITKNVDIPSKDKDEIYKIIDLQAGRYTPYSRDEIVIDFLCMEAKDQPYTNVLLVIAQRKIVTKYYDIINRIGIASRRVIVVSEALASSYEKTIDSTAEGAVAGLSISSGATDLTITDKKQLIFMRSISFGAQQLASDQASRKDFFSELQKSIASYQDQGIGRPIKNLVVGGMPEGVQLTDEEFTKEIPNFTVDGVAIKRMDPRSVFSLHDQAVNSLSANSSIVWFDLFACANTFNDLKFDLVPKEVKLKYQFREGGKDIVALGTLLMTIFLLFSVFLVSKIFLKRDQIHKLDAIDKVASEESQTLEQTSTKTRILKDLIGNRGRGLYVFEKINSMIGDDIYLGSLSYNKDGKVIFSGTADSMSRVFAFVTELEESNYFKDVKTTQTKSRREGQKEVADFEIACIVADELSTATIDDLGPSAAAGGEKKGAETKKAAPSK